MMPQVFPYTFHTHRSRRSDGNEKLQTSILICRRDQFVAIDIVAGFYAIA